MQILLQNLMKVYEKSQWYIKKWKYNNEKIQMRERKEREREREKEVSFSITNLA